MKTVERFFFPDPAANLPAIHVKMGRLASEPVPLRAVMEWCQDLINRVQYLGGSVASEEDKARVHREVDSILVYGTAPLSASYRDELTHVEEMRDELADQRALLDRVRATLSSRNISADQLTALRAAFGIELHPEGTPAASTLPVNPYPLGPVYSLEEHRKASWLHYFKESGFDLAKEDHRRAVRNDALNRQWQIDEIKRWVAEEGLGSLDEPA